MRPFSFLSTHKFHNKYIQFISLVSIQEKFSAWFDEYSDIFLKASRGEKIYFEIKNAQSKKNGYVGYIDDTSCLIDPSYISSFQNYKKNKFPNIKLKFENKEITVKPEWLVKTDKVECSENYVFPREVVRKDKIGNEIKLSSYVIWVYKNELKIGYISSFSVNGAVYAKEFNGSMETLIRNESISCITFDNSNSLINYFTKMKLKFGK